MLTTSARPGAAHEEDTVAGTTQQGKASDPKGKDQQHDPGKRRGKAATTGRAPVDDETRERILALVAEGKLSRNAIARECGVSPSTVTRMVAPGSFDRSKTAAAVAAHTVDLKAQRAELSQMAVAEVHRLFGLLTQPHVQIGWYQGDATEHVLDRPTSGDVKNYAVAIGILTDKHLALIRHDSDDRDLPAVDRWLAALGVPAAG